MHLLVSDAVVDESSSELEEDVDDTERRLACGLREITLADDADRIFELRADCFKGPLTPDVSSLTDRAKGREVMRASTVMGADVF